VWKMDMQIKEIIDELSVNIIYNSSVDDSGHYIPKINLIVLNSNLNEFEMTKALLHELGHAAYHQGNESLYRTTFSMHDKMENEAEEFMIRHLVRQYMCLAEVNPVAFNYVNFIEENELDMKMAPIVRDAFLEYGI